MAYPGMINPRHHPYDDEITLSFKRPCVCATDNIDLEKNAVYVEGTQTDNNMSRGMTELVENVWFGIRPPRLFDKQPIPVVTSRQIFITRVILEGKLLTLEVDEDLPPIKQETPTIKNVSIGVKRSAAKFLGKAGIDFDF